MNTGFWRAIAAVFTSLKLTIVCLAFAMILVVVGTLDQVDLGIYHAQKKYFDTFFVWHQFGKSGPSLPILPGGWLIGSLLLLNLFAAHFARFKLGWRRLALVVLAVCAEAFLIVKIGTYSGLFVMMILILLNAIAGIFAELRFGWKKLGITVTHVGIVLLLLGGLFTSLFARESLMQIDTGQTVQFSESRLDCELAVIDHAPADHDEVVAIPQSLLKPNAVIRHEKLPFTIEVKKFMVNSNMARRADGDSVPPEATAGLGARFVMTEAPLTVNPDSRDLPTAFIELKQGGKSIGTWMVSLWLTLVVPAPQIVEVDGKKFEIALRPERFYKPFSLTLKKFTHEKYTGTEIPKDFASLVQLKDPNRSEDREVRIFMNNPLRHGGETFYQASFKNEDKTTVLQVVKNPNWLVPYIACALVALGLLVQFGVHLVRFIDRRATA